MTSPTAVDAFFTVTARAVLQLGSELIGSDTAAFYELVKNGIDARSPRVHVRVTNRLTEQGWWSLQELVMEAQNTHKGRSVINVAEFKRRFLAGLDPTGDPQGQFVAQVEGAKTSASLLSLFAQADTIQVDDVGEGMSTELLQEAFLTIGTQIKVHEQAERRSRGSKEQPLLGEKGVGRLSAMRLGSSLEVKTTQVEEKYWHFLQIDWDAFAANPSAALSKVPVSLEEKGEKKPDVMTQGTVLRIIGLRRPWTTEQLVDLARTEFSRFQDPFLNKKPRVVLVRNQKPILVPSIASELLAHAHAVVEARYVIEDGWPRLAGTVNYALRNEEMSFDDTATEIASLSSSSIATLRKLGPFDIKFYWYNRGLLNPIETIGNTKEVRKALDQWGGGLSIYRDGFRVAPYGSLDDDWLKLDTKAFKSGGFKLNRAQIIGRIAISRDANPTLLDQTNREGLQTTPEFLALQKICRHLLEAVVRPFLEKSDAQLVGESGALLRSMTQRSKEITASARTAARQLQKQYPAAAADTEIVTHVDALTTQLSSVLKNTRRIIDTGTAERERLTVLAGIGLSMEVIAHELQRATINALATLRDSIRFADETKRQRTLTTLREELLTLQKRISIMDELSVAGRQRKSDVDLVQWTRDVVSEWEAKCERHEINLTVLVLPASGAKTVTVRIVKGMLVQVLGNLLANSTYWLIQHKRLHTEFRPRIGVTIDVAHKRVSVNDNGPGVPEKRAEAIFQPFVTTKPPGKGRGLGLYIAREIAEYHKGTLAMAAEPRIHAGRLNTFVLSLESVADK